MIQEAEAAAQRVVSRRKSFDVTRPSSHPRVCSGVTVLSGSVLRHVFAGQDEVGQAESEAEARAAKFTRLYRETLEQVADAKGRVTYFEKLFSKERKKNAVLEEKVSRLEQEIRKSKRRDRTGSIGGGGALSPPWVRVSLGSSRSSSKA